jgi:hypothetical protein
MSKCEHGKRKSRCKECGGSQICEHGKFKSRCKECGGSAFCEHGKLKSYCKECGGSALCKTPLCFTIASNPRYDGCCMPCYVNNPENRDKPPPRRNYKTKEKEVVDRIKQSFPHFTWIHDKCVPNGSSAVRPDLLLDMGSHVIIIEIDENKHANYNCSCENKRIMEISRDLEHREIIMIRFNPDAYRTSDGKYISSCWKLNKLGVLKIHPEKKDEWDQRIHHLLETIQYWINNTSSKTIEIIELFY